MLHLRSLLVIFMALSLQSCFTVKSTTVFTYKKLSPEQYAKYLKDSTDHYLIDVRTPGEYKRAHIAEARNFDFLVFHFGQDVDTLNRNKTAFIYCHTCHRSPFAARIMKHKGFRCVYDLQGGFSKWAGTGQSSLSDNKQKQ